MTSERINYKTTINGSAEQVWKALFDDATYREWTKPFAEGSYAETDWKKGSKARFYDGNNNGMLAEIADVKPNEFMSIKHVGDIKNGVEMPNPDWGGFENYTLKESNGKTELTIDLDVPSEYIGYMNDTWPTALKKLKEIVERK